jgi:hypothetical protein
LKGELVLDQLGVLFGGGSLIVAILIGLYTVYRFALADRKEEIEKKEKPYQDLLEQLDKADRSFGQTYKNGLNGFLGFLDWFYGPAAAYESKFKQPFRYFTTRSFERSLGLAYVYPVGFILIFWCFGALGSISSMPILANVPVELRLLIIPFELTLLILVSFAMKAQKHIYWGGVISYVVLCTFIALMTTQWELFLITAMFFVISCSLSISIVFVFLKEIHFKDLSDYIFYSFIWIGSHTISCIVLYPILLEDSYQTVPFLIRLIPLKVAIFVVIFIATAEKLVINGKGRVFVWPISLLFMTSMFFLVVHFYNEKIGSGVIFFAVAFWIIPIINAIFDWISVGVTRFLLSKYREEQVGWWLFWVLLDFVLAIATVAGLICVLCVYLLALNHVDQQNIWFDFDYLILQLTNELFEAPYWVYGMVISSLLPSLFHLAIVFSSLITYPFHHKERSERILAYIEEGSVLKAAKALERPKYLGPIVSCMGITVLIGFFSLYIHIPPLWVEGTIHFLNFFGS